MISRRNMMKSAAVAGVGAAMAGTGAIAMGQQATEKAAGVAGAASKNGRVRQSVCQWCFKSWDKDEFCGNAQKLGLVGIDLVGPDWFESLKKHNLIGTMTPSHGIGKGLNRKENWDECLGKIRKSIDATAEAGYPNVICFSGNRDGMDDETGLKNCTEADRKSVV